MSWVRNELVPALRAAGLQVCLDVEDFVPGRDPIQEMTRAGQESRHALCIMSPDYFANNRFVQLEALSARAGDPAGTQSSLIPFILREVDPPLWARLIPVRWTTPEARPTEWKKLLRTLGAKNLDAPPPLAPVDAPTATPTPVDAPDVPRPRIEGPNDLPELARYNFDRTAHRYLRTLGVGKAMQAGNAERLLALFTDALAGRVVARERPKRPETWLDAGCGTGLVAMLCQEERSHPAFQWFDDCGRRIGIDYAPQMLEIVKWLNEQVHCYTDLFESDIRSCDPEVLQRHTGLKSVDLIVANNVLHWLFGESAIRLALATAYAILDRNGGCLAASIAAAGTGQLFRASYAEELAKALDEDTRDKWKRHLENPIGLQSLDSVIRIAQECRFQITSGHLEYEPIAFESTDAYVEAARGYGEEVFMAPLPESTMEERDQLWDRIKENFRDRHLQATHGEARYVHDQFMIYIVAVRRD